MEEYQIDCLRHIEPDGTVTVPRPFNTRGWQEMKIEVNEEFDGHDAKASFDVCMTRWHQMLEDKLASMGGWIPSGRRSLRFCNAASWQAWADRYERFDASMMLVTPDSQEHNPRCWQRFIHGISGINNAVMDQKNSLIRQALEPLNAYLEHDGRFEIVHWRVDFPSREDLVVFQFVYG